LSTVDTPAGRAIFDDTHQDFRESIRRWLTKEIAPQFDQWEKDGIIPREAFA
jgi:acyl-CoA dehydrogenase